MKMARTGRARRGVTLLEILITVVMLAVVMLGTQRATVATATQQQIVGQSRRVAHLIANEVRDASASPLDLQDGIGGVPFNSTTLRYRLVTGYNSGTGTTLLTPSRTSLTFVQISRVATGVGGESNAPNYVQRTAPGVQSVNLASRIKDLSFTLNGTNQLTIKVTVAGKDDQGNTLEGSSEVTVALPNTPTLAN